MTTKEIRISVEDIDRDNSPEILIEFYEGGNTEFSISVSSSGGNGVYDKVNGTADANGDNQFDEADKESFRRFAQTAYHLLK
ncbi:UNVERIFIED_ORG: hypothetical protein J2W65_000896 [Pseudomonas parafulva]|uniref:hypothetical protein n=1 Tax=Pseudomonas TaxID=286 RepID=UPI0003C57668|nr:MULTISPECIES: hypothetical protein [Pseudomonas]MDP9555297.1 hypothetical protein [Pseudomonas parafulva]EST15630.1 hypothetical protein EDP1_799 [Pseudomonas putida S610]TCU00257.1 hypothetical protein EC913_102209 [Pseudomonas sp. LP_4_YM]TFA90592.1 hypothetical protein F473_00598 [Pseudomonas sp. URIL14HWK12:I1]SNB62222.1 hypothetical protein SAMN02746026_00598 [Pseudomonas sp. LAIL14HWK12:I4]